MNVKTMAFGVLASGALALSGWSATLTIPAGTETEYTDATAYAAADKIVVTAPVKLDFGSNKPAFAGEIEILSAGRLSVKNTPDSFGAPSKITVRSGGTLDVTWADKVAGGISSADIHIAGSGTDGKGAIWRGDGSAGVNTMFGKLTLDADATIGTSGIQVGVIENSSVNLEGYTLTWYGSNQYGIFYLPKVQFKKDGSTDNPGNLAVHSGYLFFRHTSLSGGSSANVITVADGGRIRLRDMTERPKWKIVAGGAFRLETDNADSSAGASAKNVWDGPIESGGTVTLLADKSPTYLGVNGGITGKKNLSGAGLGLVTVRGTNEVGRLLHNAASGTIRLVDGKTTVADQIQLDGGTVEFSNEVVRLDYESTGGFEISATSAASAAKLKFGPGTSVSARTKEDGKAYCRLYPGKDAGEFGLVELDGAYVTNLSASVGYNGIGGYWQHGGEFLWPLDSTEYNAPGKGVGSCGFYRIDRGGRFVMDTSRNGGAFLGVDGACLVDVTGASSFEIPGGGNISMVAGSGTFLARVSEGSTLTTEGTLTTATSVTLDRPGRVELTVGGENSKIMATGNIEERWTNSGALMVLNVNDGASVEAAHIIRSDKATAAGTAFYLNLDGGVLLPTRTSDSIFGGTSDPLTSTNQPTAVTVHEGGATIDTSKASGHVYIATPFVRPPAGKRIASIALPTDSAFASEKYLGAPIVTITGVGTGATAFAQFDSAMRTVTNIVVTSHGWSYATADTVVTIESADRTKTYVCPVTLEDRPAGGKGFVKRGSNRLDLFAANTYNGPTTVEEGILGFECTLPDVPQGGLPLGSGLILKSGSTFTVNNPSASITVPFIRGCGTTSYGYYTITNALEATAEDVLAGRHLTVNRRLTMADGAVIRISGAELLEAEESTASFCLVEVKGTLVTSGVPKLEIVDGDATDHRLAAWMVRIKIDGIYLKRTTGTLMIFR